ncbi:TetR/AcrR family transcriptional regulator [Nocardia bovistercoris]|uniref:TetR family transcriptional regulator n=1 Tax=Nocardia bovistercoris TaxID=2785916 RepID=A0A931I9M8_9NOCA|nr:TetR/AcrR family transcriptional regulator [Nocardia bovistercoris]MBH0776415.1 TetR family transcriptional regulator [Nocardia bovistercoris]
MTDAPPRRRDRVATRAALLDAARIRFARNGFEATKVRDIAADVGVDPALLFRYFGAKEKLYAEAMRVEIPRAAHADPHRPVVHIADELLREVVFDEWPEFGGEHPLLAMLRSSGLQSVRDQLRSRLCEDYLREFAERLGGSDAALRAEMVGALLLGLGVMRVVVAAPALGAADVEQTRGLVADMVRAITRPASPETDRVRPR